MVFVPDLTEINDLVTRIISHDLQLILTHDHITIQHILLHARYASHVQGDFEVSEQRFDHMPNEVSHWLSRPRSDIDSRYTFFATERQSVDVRSSDKHHLRTKTERLDDVGATSDS